MRFLMIYRPEDTKKFEAGVPPTPEEMARMGQFIDESMKSGALLATEGCLPTAMGARVRQSRGRTTVTDGPFTEAKEIIAGFALVQAGSKEEAIEMARRFLNVAGDGDTEIRQVFDGPAGAP